ncbi:uncharacterized protein LOC109863218 isoform X2 [Pseudomyrmex gracilis]|uniref:uncharacterized protein LOC109863218 isoform X2 n=1 Tax=Pseudomyrmex gracilis TaxID=219809 RepID=UPI0009955730|nr:uncharacterized protein LOC109863218 isoform X2 [Pseudomyrmex gracilis]
MAVVKSIGEYSEIDFSIKLEFVSSNIAQKMCLLSPMTYENLKIELRQERSIDTIHEEAFIGHADSTAPRPLNLRLKTDYELFVQLLYNLRHSFRERNYDSALARLKADLRVHNIYEDIDSLRKKRTKVIVNNYKTMSKSGGSLMEFFVPVGVIKGKLDERKLTGSLFEKEVESVVSSSDFIEPLCFFEEAAVWTNVATKALIKACIEHREDYKKHEYRTRYWQKIRKYLYEKKHYYSAAGCEGKMLQLKRTFRDEEQARRQTGAPGPSTTHSWEFYEDMRQLMEGDVTVTPHVTAAFGSSQVITEKEKISLSSHKENSQRIGKAASRNRILSGQIAAAS